MDANQNEDARSTEAINEQNRRAINKIREMAGGFVLVVGPSGAGKDTLIGLARRSLAGDPRFVFPRRLVTRAGSVHEDNERIDEATFEAGRAAGRLALAWRAHGLGYAVPASARDSALRGHVVVCNVSRALLEEARASLPDVSVVEISASEPVLSRRLEARDRSADGDIEAYDSLKVMFMGARA